MFSVTHTVKVAGFVWTAVGVQLEGGTEVEHGVGDVRGPLKTIFNIGVVNE